MCLQLGLIHGLVNCLNDLNLKCFLWSSRWEIIFDAIKLRILRNFLWSKNGPGCQITLDQSIYVSLGFRSTNDLLTLVVLLQSIIVFFYWIFWYILDLSVLSGVDTDKGLIDVLKKGSLKPFVWSYFVRFRYDS